jgi:uncharacterized protein
MRSTVLKTLWILVLVIVLLGLPRLAGIATDAFNFKSIDPDGAFAWLSVHHIIMAIMALLLIITVKLVKPLDFGFGRGDRSAGKKYVLRFTLIFASGAVGMYGILFLIGAFKPFAYPLTAANIAGHLGFQLLLSGPSEELFFRAFAITLLAAAVKRRTFKGRVSWANILAALIFGMAHLGFAFAPFAVHYDLMQVILAVTLGLFYGDCYEKTKSMVYPMVMHSISNVITAILTVILTFL